MEETAAENSARRDPVPLNQFLAFIDADNLSTEDLRRLAIPLFACKDLPQLVQESTQEDQDRFVSAADRVRRFSLAVRCFS